MLARTAYAAPFLVFLVIYVPAAGHRFIADDFSWILHNRIRGISDVWRIALRDNGFSRPAVAFSFAATELLFGLTPLAYGPAAPQLPPFLLPSGFSPALSSSRRTSRSDRRRTR